MNTPASVEVILALGSNLGDRASNLRAACTVLEERGLEITRRSSVYETPPFPPGQPRYLNAAIAATTALAPHDLLATTQAIEQQLGRVQSYRWGPRAIDIDILFYGHEAIATETLTIPHPRIPERPFVLIPLRDITSSLLPVLGSSADDLLEPLSLEGIDRTAEQL